MRVVSTPCVWDFSTIGPINHTKIHQIWKRPLRGNSKLFWISNMRERKCVWQQKTTKIDLTCGTCSDTLHIAQIQKHIKNWWNFNTIIKFYCLWHKLRLRKSGLATSFIKCNIFFVQHSTVITTCSKSLLVVRSTAHSTTHTHSICN